ncbi:fungal chitosanase of glycosyl hydrolase group 75-domain-containing protein [Aspergillus carlsbadensis]|nr:fungal chitosanase of glycosyl hydrolase group 75-domain-containing protein [Aspergillus carlsbadensis]
MALKRALALLVVLLSTLLAMGQKVNGPEYNKPDGGPPASYFQAAATMPVAALQTAATCLSETPGNAVHDYKLSSGSNQMSTIYTDWARFDAGAAVVWTADMDVDCDGINYKCDGNKDGQAQTDYGALSAYAVPFIVIPQEYVSSGNQAAIPGNNVAAVICNGKMFYGILGDTNGNDPQVTGEASWLMARTCFPDDDLRGNSGHGEADVTYILFTGPDAVLSPSALNKHYITDFGMLKSMGDRLVNGLLGNLRLPGTTPSEDGGPQPPPPAQPQSQSQSQPQAPPPDLPPASSSSPPPPSITGPSEQPPSHTLTLAPSPSPSVPNPGPEAEPAPSPSAPGDNNGDDDDCDWSGHCEGSSASSHLDPGTNSILLLAFSLVLILTRGF